MTGAVIPSKRYKHLYGHRWQQRRLLFLAAHPLCRFCELAGRTCAGEVVDHIVPHRGNSDLFFDETNWQTLCKLCHDSAKQAEEHYGFSIAVGVDGWPVDDKHPANAGMRMKGKRWKRKAKNPAESP